MLTAQHQNDDPVTALHRAVRKDCGKVPSAGVRRAAYVSSTATIRTGATNCTTVTEGLLRPWVSSTSGHSRACISRF